MQGYILDLHETEPPSDPYRARRYGFWFTFACPVDAVGTPVATSLRRLPPQDWAYERARSAWWVAEEHLPVLRRLFSNFDDCFQPASAQQASA